MNETVRLVLLAHAPMATAWRQLAAHTFADCAAQLETLDIDPGDSLEQAQERLRGLLGDGKRPTLVLVDVAGATPANALQALLPNYPQLRAVAGLNGPMLWRTLCYRQESLDALTERAEAGGLRGIIKLT
ncbi:PTS sugar transporter subunit IIA [Inhella sp.]|uniref:PTS sugar transporter subunit IIA n=1 Tax=Inhella sp. TaxID=1921806 RepID=UPI0035AE023B